MADATQTQMEGFSLGRPALVCRWRLSGCRVPLENRHLRALGARIVNGAPVPPELVAWAKQHVEWTLDAGAAGGPDGVLMLIVDEAGQAAMTVGPFEPLSSTTTSALARRAASAEREAARTGVAPEELWAVRDGVMLWGSADEARPSGSATLVRDLLRTLGMTVTRTPGLAEMVLDGTIDPEEAFLVSDEFGVVPAEDRCRIMGDRLADGYARLLEKTSRKH